MARKVVNKTASAKTTVKAENTKTAAAKTEAVKSEPKAEVKAEESKKAIATKKDTTKAIETKAGVLKEAPAAEETAEKTEETKKAVKNPAAKKKAEVKTELFLQFAGKEFSEKDIFTKVKEIWSKELKNKVGDMKEVKVYLKPEESAAYFVVNGEVSGKVEL